ncbi:MAG: hypothetical protein C0593_05060 [Marinilabiliales bacterium]|nr:MAG: hypothetical protein C0593_05060 [Marinilabiliales bacterium]
MKKIFLSVVILFTSLLLTAQQSKPVNVAGPKAGMLTGVVLEGVSNTPVEYANVALYSKRDSSVVGGTVTDSKGVFKIAKLAPGPYYAYVKFIGFETELINNIRITPGEPNVDLGVIRLRPGAENIEGVEIVGERNQIVYKLDKKIITPATIISSQGGTAVDVLENTPSVQVDIEGNVSLRGSENFMVLIDGRPTPLDPSDALQQIPASTIENIEIITNPSAKYDPDGTSGIINIITKKNMLEGISGKINVNADTKGAYGGDGLISFRNSKLNAFVGINYNQRVRTGHRTLENHNIFNDTTLYTLTEGDRGGGRLSAGIKAGIDYSITDKDIISINGRVSQMAFERNSTNNYTEYSLPYSSAYELISISDDNSKRSHDFYSGNIMYQHLFNDDGHKIEASVNYQAGTSDDISLNEKTTENGTLLLGQKSTEIGEDRDIRIKVDYVYPISDKYKLEAGYQSRLESEAEDYLYYEADLSTGEYINIPSFNNNSAYTRNIHAVYGMFAGEYSKISYQLGLRGEYTDRVMEHEGDDEPFTINRFDLFPTLHTAFQLPAEQQIYVSYARRIERPRNWFLEPFLSWMDAYNIRTGNPELLPEYIDSYELGYLNQFEDSYFSFEGFFRQTHNKVERTRTTYEGNIMLNSFENVGTDYSTGVEAMYNGKLTKWWTLTATGNLYHYLVKGELYGKEFEQTSINYGGRLSNTFTISRNTRMQLDGMYRGPSATAQGEMKGFFFSNLSLKQQLLDRKMTLTLQVSDIFGTGKHEAYIYGENYYSHYVFERDAPVFRATLTWNFNNYRPDRKSRNGESGDGDMQIDDF